MKEVIELVTTRIYTVEDVRKALNIPVGLSMKFKVPTNKPNGVISFNVPDNFELLTVVTREIVEKK